MVRLGGGGRYKSAMRHEPTVCRGASRRAPTWLQAWSADAKQIASGGILSACEGIRRNQKESEGIGRTQKEPEGIRSEGILPGEGHGRPPGEDHEGMGRRARVRSGGCAMP